MASAKLAAAALAAVVLVCAAATTATAYRPEPQPQPQAQHEDCQTQAGYFKNCLSYGLHKGCCTANIVTDPECYCVVEREAVIQCAHGKSCHAVVGKAGSVKVREMDLPCLQNLHCKRA